MSDSTLRKTVTIVNPQGLHARPANLFVQLAKEYEASVRVRKGSETVDGKSILNLLTLAAVQGTELEITARGSDAKEALEALSSLVEQGFEIETSDSPTR